MTTFLIFYSFVVLANLTYVRHMEKKFHQEYINKKKETKREVENA